MSEKGVRFNQTAQGLKADTQQASNPTVRTPSASPEAAALGMTLLLEVSQKNPNTMKIADLLQRGASLEETNAHGSTPLLVTARSGHETISDMLIQKGADVNARDTEGNTPLILAVTAGSTKTVRNLLDQDARMETLNKLDRSALMWAAALGRREIAQMLLRKGADLDLHNGAGQTAYDIAKQHENHSLAAILKAGAQQQKTPAVTRPSLALRATLYKDMLKKA